MRIGALDRKILRDAWHIRGQIVACALVVAGGINSFVSLSSVNRTLAASQAAFYEEYRFADVFAGAVRAPDPVAASLAAIPGVAALETRVAVRVNLDVPGLAEPARGRILSISKDPGGGLNALHLRRGRLPAAESQDEVVASEAFAIANGLSPGDAIRGVIHGKYKSLRVVGVAISPEFIYALGPASSSRQPALRRAVDGPQGARQGPRHGGGLQRRDRAGGPRRIDRAVLKEMDRVLAPYGGVGAYDREDQLSHRFLSDEIAQNRTMARITPTIFLLVGAFLLYTILTRLVQMQRSQVGLLKAFGYSGGEISLHYLKLALLISLFGATLGVATGLPFGHYLLELYAEYYFFPMYGNDQGARVAGVGIALAVAAAALGAVPAALRARGPRAGRLDAARAAAALSRRVHRALGAAARALALGPHAGAQPRPASASLRGERLRHRHRGGAPRDDDGHDGRRALPHGVAVHDRAARGRAGPAHGAARALRPRRVPVPAGGDGGGALPHGPLAHPWRPPHEARGALRHRSGPTLRRVVDGDGRAWTVPPEGVLLTAIFAKTLEVKAGDTVEIELMDGNRSRTPMLVMGVVDEPIGFAAYVSRATANRLLGEGDVLTGAYLRVDARERERVFALLKAMPEVAGANLREAAYTQFKAMIDRSVGIMITVNLVFAWIIAFGLVYNGARIALSERGYELATLRVLGFTQRESATLLLGEQGVITGVGLPLGLALGIALTLYFIWMLSTQMWRMPYVVTGANLVGAMAAVAAAAVASGGAVAWHLRHLDLVAALKARE